MKNKSLIAMLAAMMSTRMLGLFMILPVFAVAATHLSGATPKLIGLTLGIYGLTQALFQIPLGLLSDHIGRKRVIFAGLCIFLLGSIVGANAHTIHTMLLARALQGAGAIGSTILALVSDITSEQSRTKAMAMIGMSIGCSFMIAMILGPILNHTFQLSGIFWMTAGLALTSMLLLTRIPHTKSATHYFDQAQSSRLLINKKLLLLDISVFSLHCILTAMFIAIPIALTKQFLFSSAQQIILYCVILLLSFVFAVPLIITAEKRGKIRHIFHSMIACVVFCEGLLFFTPTSRLALCAILLLFLRLLPHLKHSYPPWFQKPFLPKEKVPRWVFIPPHSFWGFLPVAHSAVLYLRILVFQGFLGCVR